MLIRLAFGLLAVFLLIAPLSAGDAFVEGFEDLPLAPGLVNVPEAGTGFDKPTGRIVVAYASGKTNRAAVEKFYSSTLPQLGWTRQGSAYLREGERLTIEVLGAEGGVTVRYTLAPI
jgi:hypothetical protein